MPRPERFTYPIYAAVDETFAPDAFSHYRDLPAVMKTPMGETIEITLIGAKVEPGGKTVMIEVEAPFGVALLVDSLQILETTHS